MNEEIKKIDQLITRMKFFFHDKGWKKIYMTNEEADEIIRALETKKALLERLEDDGK